MIDKSNAWLIELQSQTKGHLFQKWTTELSKRKWEISCFYAFQTQKIGNINPKKSRMSIAVSMGRRKNVLLQD